MAEDVYDFIVVGGGAAGCVLASRLARNDRDLKVLLIEAGNEHADLATYQVPAFHGLASEDPRLRWDFFVDHFTDPTRHRDEKAAARGILYPRASALGGCTAHHAMITVYPDRSDWDSIAQLTADASWRHARMWDLFRRATRDWLPISAAGFATAIEGGNDPVLARILGAALRHAPNVPRQILDTGLGLVGSLFHLMSGFNLGDPNNPEQIAGNREGVYRIPLSVRDGKRHGAAEFLFATRSHPRYAANLTIWPDRLATRVIFEEGRAAAVEVLPRARAYRADRDAAGDRRPWAEARRDLSTVRARREIVLCGGAFNTPQLLMLSGIGPPAQLAAAGVPVVAARAGVGANLQDRYEIAVIDDLAQELAVLSGYGFNASPDDAGYRRWSAPRRSGLYTTNGGTIAFIKRSRHARTPDCDLFIFGLPIEFRGYELNYSERVRQRQGRSRFSWVILKAHTDNAGEITLRSPDPRDPPRVNFKNFKDGQQQDDPDLLALEEAVGFVRTIMAPLRGNGETVGEWRPGIEKIGQALRDFIVANAWGHHASCTCAIGRSDDPRAVLDSAFRVIGAPGANLRVVDASAFPRIPGTFIALPVYLVAEKAADVILAAYGARTVRP